MPTLAQYLMLAVLEQAVADLESRSLTIRRKALAWFLATGTRTNHIFSFPRICREFGYNPDTVRSRILGNGSQTPHEAWHEAQRAAG